MEISKIGFTRNHEASWKIDNYEIDPHENENNVVIYVNAALNWLIHYFSW